MLDYSDIEKATSMPCYDCHYAYVCRYFKNDLWTSWILSTKECPAFKYNFDSIQNVFKRKIYEPKTHKSKLK